MKEIIIKLKSGFAWKFSKFPEMEGGIILSDDYKKKKLSDLNIGFDKSNRKEFLQKIEYLTRKEVTVKLKFILEECEYDTPHHLDNRAEFIKYEKQSFENLIIERFEYGKEFSINNESLILRFGKLEINEFFTKMYVNFEIYGTYEDNIIEIKNPITNENLRLVIWGVSNGNPIYY